ncbi:MAG: nucleoside recognition domain-containing protein [bacterium]
MSPVKSSSVPDLPSLVRSSVREGLRSGLRQALWLLRIIVPVSLVVFLLQELGALAWISGLLSPVFAGVGLSGVGAIAFVAGVLSNPYTVVAIIGTAALPAREIAILSVMSLIAHNFPVELAILRRTGSSVVRMFAVRITAAVLAGLSLRLLLPEAQDSQVDVSTSEAAEVLSSAGSGTELRTALAEWAGSTVQLAAVIVLILCTLMVTVQLLRRLGVIETLAKFLAPLMRVFGLPVQTSFLWLVCNLLGITYGSAVLLEEERSGRLTAADGDLLNHHVSISHSILEDTLVFVAVGAPLLWISVPRLILAALAVWLRRAELALRRRLGDESPPRR